MYLSEKSNVSEMRPVVGVFLHKLPDSGMSHFPNPPLFQLCLVQLFSKALFTSPTALICDFQYCTWKTVKLKVLRIYNSIVTYLGDRKHLTTVNVPHVTYLALLNIAKQIR